MGEFTDQDVDRRWTIIVGQALASKIREIIRRVGPDIKYEQCIAELQKENIRGCKQSSFDRSYYNVFVGVIPKETPEETPEIKINLDGNLSDLIRFASVVAAIGGVENARQYLSLIENLKKLI